MKTFIIFESANGTREEILTGDITDTSVIVEHGGKQFKFDSVESYATCLYVEVVL